MIRHVIFKNHAKNGLPISHAELIEVVNKKYTGSAKKGLSRHIIRLAQSKILQIFGMELREVHRPVASAKGTSNKSAAGETEHPPGSLIPGQTASTRCCACMGESFQSTRQMQKPRRGEG